MKIIKLLLSVLFLASSASAQNIGRNPKAIASPHFDYSAYVAALQGVELQSFGFLWNTFGNYLVNAEKEIRRPSVKDVVMELGNETCVSRGDCGSYEILAGYTTESLRRAIRNSDPKLRGKVTSEGQRLANWLLPILRPDQRCLINLLLETKQRPEDVRTLGSWLPPELRARCGFVWNPVGGSVGMPPPGFVISEAHGPNPQFADSRCIANPDGSPPPDGDWEAFLRHYGLRCEITMGWDQDDNIINRGQLGRVDPRKRKPANIQGFKPMGQGMRAAQKPAELPPPWTENDDLSKAGCHSINPTSDRDGGFIWKQSHVPGYRGTILFPARFEKFKKVVIRKAGKAVGRVVYAPGVGFPDQAAHNQKRPIWRTDRDIKKYPFNVVIRGAGVGGKTHCWALSNPRIRND